MLGPDKNFINQKEIKDNFFSKINSTSTFIDETTNKLIEGKIIASYYGRNEVGPRSLGNTSIFCDASNEKAVKNLNSNIKKGGTINPWLQFYLQKTLKNISH